MLKLINLIFGIFASVFVCGYTAVQKNFDFLYMISIPYVFTLFFIGLFGTELRGKRLLLCRHGLQLLYSFLFCSVTAILYHLILAPIYLPNDRQLYLYSCLWSVCSLAVMFVCGVGTVYMTSFQLGIKHRLLGIFLCLIPVVNIAVLVVILVKVHGELEFELKKQKTDRIRKDLRMCETKYPILLVHGIFFRDFRYVNYWGRIPQALINNGAVVYYGNHSSACSIEEGAKQLSERMKQIAEQTGCEKLNVIAHSKGGLDTRYAIEYFGAGKYIASLTTVNTPHRGCMFVDHLLQRVPKKAADKIAATYNNALAKLGERDSDFMAAVGDLTDIHCKQLDASMPQPKGIYCQSIGSVVKSASGGRFPMNVFHDTARRFSGENDGLVAETSFKWGEKYILLRPDGLRGISHGDMIDLNRENIPGFDVREFYVELVADLKKRGL